MKTVYLLRHAKSSWADTALDDADRPLSKRGRQTAKRLGRYLLAHGITPAQVLCSPSKRTRETFERLQKSMGTSVAARFEQALYLADAPSLLRRLKRLSDGLPSVMLIGHNPGLERLALLLAPAGEEMARDRLAEKFPTGGLAVVTADINHWQELRPGSAYLTAFIRPRDLEVDDLVS
jgi:phosphohistidine phosphatase